MRSRSLAALGAVLLLAPPLRAQDDAAQADTTPATSLQVGARSISFLAPVYGGSGYRAEFGTWKMVNPRTNRGFTLRLTVGATQIDEDDREATHVETSLGLGLNVRRYMAPPNDVNPYVHGAVVVNGNYRRLEVTDVYEEVERGVGAGAETGLGVEWFPVRRISLSGHTGFGVFARVWDAEVTREDDGETDVDGKSGFLNTFTSALTLQIYF